MVMLVYPCLPKSLHHILWNIESKQVALTAEFLQLAKGVAERLNKELVEAQYTYDSKRLWSYIYSQDRQKIFKCNLVESFLNSFYLRSYSPQPHVISQIPKLLLRLINFFTIPLGLTVDRLVVHHLALKPRSCFEVSDLNSIISLLSDDLMTR